MTTWAALSLLLCSVSASASAVAHEAEGAEKPLSQVPLYCTRRCARARCCSSPCRPAARFLTVFAFAFATVLYVYENRHIAWVADVSLSVIVWSKTFVVYSVLYVMSTCWHYQRLKVKTQIRNVFCFLKDFGSLGKGSLAIYLHCFI